MVYEDSIGPHGIPWVQALDPENDGWFEAHEVVDFAQAALDRWREDHKGKAVEPGTRVTVRDLRRASAVADEPRDEQPEAG